ncbi:DNA polymerase [Acetobacterium sp.]|uniref:DNA polymerase n=1 Tax=Acetobacterium sp. TaxID=1872094 RepID=UPI003592F3E0
MKQLANEKLVYQTLIDIGQLAAYLDGATMVAFDFETAPQARFGDVPEAALDPHQAEITGISLAVLPLLKKTVFENPGCLKIAHNLAFEAKFLLAAEIVLQPPVFDTIAGVRVDQPQLKQNRAIAAAALTALRQQLEHPRQRVVKVGANAATNDFKAYLFEDLGLPVLKTTATGKPSVDNEALLALLDYAQAAAPEVLDYLALVADFRRMSKLDKTYLVGLGSRINPATAALHPQFLPLGAETGRFTSVHPNCQNLPAGAIQGISVRDLLVARPGKTLVALDYSQIELRIGAWLTRDKQMMAVYRHGGDIHAMTTAGVYGISLAQASDKNEPRYKERRAVAKNINFGIFYGLYPKGLQRILRLKAGLNLSLEACESMIFNIHLAYPGLAPWQQGVIRQASYDEKMATALGRQRCLPGINDPDEALASQARRAALNHPIQGTAADILKLAMARLLPLLAGNPAITPLLTVHDELVFEVDDAVLTPSIARLKEIMEAPPFPGFDLPLVVEVSVGTRYGSLTPMGWRLTVARQRPER